MNIEKIEKAIKQHSSYTGSSGSGEYLNIMDSLAWGRPGTPSDRLCSLLEDYFKIVNVNNLDEAIQRLKKGSI